jgi:hypothetical protein
MPGESSESRGIKTTISDISERTLVGCPSISDVVDEALEGNSVPNTVQQDGKRLYRPLIGPDAIRVLALQPAASYSSELRGTLLETTLSKCDYDIIESFTALSYVWGDPLRENYIRVDGISTAITASLDLALRELRDTTRVLRMWADALCINQSNIPERNQQVSLMGHIYATARNTIIHLGPSTPEAESVLGELLSKTSITHQISETGTRINKASKGQLELVQDHILTRPWFRRVWVLQELVLSKDPWLQCGAIRVRWKDFCLFLRQILTALDNQKVDFSTTSGGTNSWNLLKNMNDIRSGAASADASTDLVYQHRIDRTLLSVLTFRRGLGAADPRDLVFAHLGIASDHSKINNKKTHTIQINYQNSCVQVYAQVAFYIVNETNYAGSLKGRALQQLLGLCGDFHPENRMANLPSWVPDVSVALGHVIKDNV